MEQSKSVVAFVLFCKNEPNLFELSQILANGVGAYGARPARSLFAVRWRCASAWPMTEDRLLQRCLHGRHDRARARAGSSTRHVTLQIALAADSKCLA